MRARKVSCRKYAVVLFGLFVVFLWEPVIAQSMSEAIVAAYLNNPALKAARVAVKEAKEGKRIALSGYFPKIAGFGNVELAKRGAGEFPSPSEIRHRDINTTMGIKLTQPLFDGFQTSSAVQVKTEEIKATQEMLRNVEQSTINDVAVVFSDILRYESALSLSKSNISFFKERVRTAKKRAAVGEGTTTDVAQAEAYYQKAITSLHSNMAALKSSEAMFLHLVGMKPKKLAQVLSLDPILPRSLEEGIDLALVGHPVITYKIHKLKSAKLLLEVQKGSLLPSVGLQVEANYSSNPTWGVVSDSLVSTGISLGISIPIYAGGSANATLRRTKALIESANLQVHIARSQVRTQVVTAWENLAAARSALSSAKAEIKAAEKALFNMTNEYNVGQGTLLDVLNLKTSAISAHTALASAKSQNVAASFALLASTGQLNIKKLGLLRMLNPH